MAFPQALLEIFYGSIFFQAQAQAPGPYNISAMAILILINIVSIKYQNPQQTLFDMHPKTLFSGILFLLLYFLAFDYHHRLGMRYNRPMALDGFLHRCAGFLGYMTMATLASLIFPDWAIPLVYACYTRLSVGDVVVIVCRKMGGWVRRIVAAEQGNILPFYLRR